MWNAVFAVVPLALALPLGEEGGNARLYLPIAIPIASDDVALDLAVQAGDDEFERLRKQLDRLVDQMRDLQKDLKKMQETIGEMAQEHGETIAKALEEMLEPSFRGVDPERMFRVLPKFEWDEDSLRKMVEPWGQRVEKWVKQWGDEGEFPLAETFRVQIGKQCPYCRGCEDCQARIREAEGSWRGKIRGEDGTKKKRVIRRTKKSPFFLQVPEEGRARARVYVGKDPIEGLHPFNENTDVRIFRLDSDAKGKGKIIIRRNGETIEREFDIDGDGILELDIDDLLKEIEDEIEMHIEIENDEDSFF